MLLLRIVFDKLFMHVLKPLESSLDCAMLDTKSLSYSKTLGGTVPWDGQEMEDLFLLAKRVLMIPPLFDDNENNKTGLGTTRHGIPLSSLSSLWCS